MFKFKFLNLASILATFALLSCAGFADTNYDFKGAINFSNSAQNLVGQELEYSFTLLSDTPASSYEVFPGYLENDFQASSVQLKINGVAYALPNYFIPAVGYTSQYGDEFGFVALQNATGLTNPAQVQFGFFSTSPTNVDSNYLPLAGLAVSDFSGLIRVYDDTFGVEGNYYQGLAEATITSYSVTKSTVPESGPTLLLFGFSVIGLAVIRRKSVQR